MNIAANTIFTPGTVGRFTETPVKEMDPGSALMVDHGDPGSWILRISTGWAPAPISRVTSASHQLYFLAAPQHCRLDGTMSCGGLERVQLTACTASAVTPAAMVVAAAG